MGQWLAQLYAIINTLFSINGQRNVVTNSPRRAVLTRGAEGPDGTPGVWLSDSGFSCKTVERPWLNNAPDVSCIPVGVYTCHWGNSPLHGWCFYVMDVPNRGNIEIHSANLYDQLLGCIAPGLDFGVFVAGTMMHIEGPNGLEVAPLPRNMKGVINSKEALALLEHDLGTNDFQLTIR